MHFLNFPRMRKNFTNFNLQTNGTFVKSKLIRLSIFKSPRDLSMNFEKLQNLGSQSKQRENDTNEASPSIERFILPEVWPSQTSIRIDYHDVRVAAGTTVPIFTNERLSSRFAPIAINWESYFAARSREFRWNCTRNFRVARASDKGGIIFRVGNQSRYRDISIIELTAVYTRR